MKNCSISTLWNRFRILFIIMSLNLFSSSSVAKPMAAMLSLCSSAPLLRYELRFFVGASLAYLYTSSSGVSKLGMHTLIIMVFIYDLLSYRNISVSMNLSNFQPEGRKVNLECTWRCGTGGISRPHQWLGSKRSIFEAGSDQGLVFADQ